MTKLDDCIARAGKALSKRDANALRGIFSERGMSESGSVEDRLSAMQRESDAILNSDIGKQVERHRVTGYLRLIAPAIKDNNELKSALGTFYGIKRNAVKADKVKMGQEILEELMVERARSITAEFGDKLKGAFDALLEMYQKQPRLNVRSSTSMANQAYSTPAPLAFLATKMATANQGSDAQVMEPTAGNGMLLIDTKPDYGIVNELEPSRAQALRNQGFEVTENDASDPAWSVGTNVDAVVANPPFGKLRNEDRSIRTVPVDGYKIREIDHLISANALQQMEPGGGATLIIGADHRKPGNVRANDKVFFNWLYSNYNVRDHFEVDGRLYERQGAGWTVAVIQVDGRRDAPAEVYSPRNGEIERLDNWQAIYERAAPLMAPRDPAERGSGDSVSSEAPPLSADDAADVGSRPDGQVSNTGEAQPELPSRTGRTAPAGDEPRTGANATPDVRSDGEPAVEPVREAEPGTRSARDATGKSDAKRSDAKPAVPGLKKPAKQKAKASGFQSIYEANSKGFNEEVLTPKAMADPTKQALADIAADVGDLDTYVQKKLGYKSKKELHKHFFGLQVDAVAAAIYNFENKDKGIIIADQTGVGKGRQAAAVLRYAMREGKTPIFLTVKENLFTDMYNDLQDIGTTDARPFILNQAGKVVREGQKPLFKNPARAKHKATMEEIARTGELPDNTNMLFFTYSQVNTDNLQRQVVNALKDNAVIVMDESHNAAGDRESFSKGVDGKSTKKTTGAGFLYEVIEGQSVAYLSATYAKRPDNMPIYYRTDVMDAVDSPDQLIDAVAAGGTPLQTVMSSMLAQSGQLFRRERSFDGIAIPTVVDYENGKTHAQIADQVTTGLRAVTDADRQFVSDMVEAAKEAAERQGGGAIGAGNKASSTIDHTNFNSVVHNYIRQMLLALKAPKMVEHAIEAHKRGEKPVIALESTMGSFLDQYATDHGLEIGDPVTANYQDILLRALERTRRISTKDAKGDSSTKQYSLAELPPRLRKTYEDAEELIRSIDIEDLPLSPIDYVRQKLSDAGIRTTEITGRGLTIDYSGDVPVLAKRDSREIKNRRGEIDAFNAGELDAMVLNVAGATGMSIHAKKGFKDNKVRHMIVAQPMLDVNILVQMLGRVNRTGQVVVPKYTVMGLDLPAEKRPLASTARKMKSLNANTSANSESDTSLKAPDMFNKYGDRVVGEWLAENIDVAHQLDMSGNSDSQPPPGTAMQMTGRMALLPVEKQTEIYEELEGAYNSLIDYLNKTNQNDLETATVDLDAKVVESKIAYEGKAPETIFGQHTTLHKIDAKYQGKPPTADEAWEGAQSALETSDNNAILAQKAKNDAAGAALDGRRIRHETTLEEFLAKLPEEPTPTQITKRMRLEKAVSNAQKALDLHQNATNATANLLNEIHPGKRVYLDLGEEHAPGFVMSITDTSKPNVGSAFAPSKTRVRFMVASGVREIEVNLNQLVGEKSILVQTNSDLSEEAIRRDFARSAKDRREVRYVATGNLIAGSANLPGRIINFTDSNGAERQGILTPKTFDSESWEKIGSDQPVPVRDVAIAAKYMRDNGATVASSGLGVQIEWAGQEWEISVFKSNKDQVSRSVRHDAKLLSIMDGDFYGSGKRMTQRFENNKLPQVLERVMEIAPLQLPSEKRALWEAAGGPKQAVAAGMDGEAVAESDARFSERPTTSGLDMSQDARMKRARAMGFDTEQVWYHGTIRQDDGAGISTFDEKRIGSRWGADEEGFFFTNDQDLADLHSSDETDIAIPGSSGGAIYPVHLRATNFLLIDDAFFENKGIEPPIGRSEEVDTFWDNNKGQILEWARAAGSDGVVLVDNTNDRRMAVAFSSKDIRSINAAFDPGKSDSSDIRFNAKEPFAKIRGITLKQLDSAIAKVTPKLDSGLTVRTVQSMNDLPQAYLDSFASKNEGRESNIIAGLYERSTQTIYIVADSLNSPAEAISTLAHEAVGHYAMSLPAFDDAIVTVNSLIGRDPIVDRWASYVDRVYGPLDPSIRLEEIVAHMAENGIKHGVINRLIVGVRRLLRSVGVTVTIDNRELRAMIASAARGVGVRLPPTNNGGLPPRLPSDHPSLFPRENFEYAPNIETVWSWWKYRFVDRFNPLHRIQQAIKEQGGEIRSRVDAHLAQRLFHGKTENDITEFEREHVEPLAKFMSDNNITESELGLFLYARHAPERNAQIARINPEIPEAGSGMSDANASEIVGKAQEEGKLGALMEVAGKVDDMIEATRQKLVDSGLESEGTIDAWRGLAENEIDADAGDSELIAYNYYVPLMGFSEPKPGVTDAPRMGRGMAIRGRESMNALGRRSLAENPLLNTITQAERAIVRARKAEVGKALLNLAHENPNRDLWKVWEPGNMPMTRRLNQKTGEVELAVDRGAFNQDRFFPVKVEGRQYFVEIHEKRLAEAMQNMDVDQMEGFFKVSAWFTRRLSIINTSANLAFVPYNFARDIQTAVVHILADQKIEGHALEGKKLALATVRDTIPAMIGAWRGYANTDNPGQWGELFKQFMEDGGKVGHYGAIDMKAQSKKLSKLLAAEQPGPYGMTKRLWRGLVEFVDRLNTAVENAVRLSLYVNAIRQGVSRPQAAGAAKSLTVDFNQRGAWGSKMNALYMFSNASVQGSTEIVKRMAGGKIAFFAGLALASAGFTALVRAVMGDDYEDIPDYVKDRNFIIPNLADDSGQGYFTIPQPYGYNAASALGVAVADVAAGKKDPAEAALFTAGAFVGSFNPLGMDGNVASTLAPTLAVPLVHIESNTAFHGGPVMPDNPFSTTPDSQKHWSTTPDNYLTAAELMNSLTGGSEYRSGAIDVSPESLQEVWEYFTGGMGRTIERALDVPGKAIEGKLEAKDFPIVRRVVRKTDDTVERRKFYDRQDGLQQIRKENKETRGPARVQFRRDFRNHLRVDAKLVVIEKQMRRLRKLIKATTNEQRIEDLRAKETKLIEGFNKAYDDAGL